VRHHVLLRGVAKGANQVATFGAAVRIEPEPAGQSLAVLLLELSGRAGSGAQLDRYLEDHEARRRGGEAPFAAEGGELGEYRHQ
jgi:hypothetical protein